MAVPKKRKSKSRTSMRRSQHDKARVPTLGPCPECGEPKQPHRVCLSCGVYNGKQLLTVAG